MLAFSEASDLNVHLKAPQLLFALAACAAIIAGCGGSGNQAPVVPATSNNNAANKPATVGRRILFYSVDYIKAHPELAPHGDRDRGLHTMASGSGPLQYYGGPVQRSPKIYLIFWGWSSASDTAHDPNGVANYLGNYANALGGSNLGNVQTQYHDNSGNITNPHPEYAGAWYDSSFAAAQ